MLDSHPLLSLPDRELDARLAECMEPMPQSPPESEKTLCAWICGGVVPISLGGAWMAVCDYNDGDVATWVPQAFSSPSSPRSLLESVEAEIERRNLWYEYVRAITDALGCSEHPTFTWERFRALTAPAKVRAAAAVAVMEGK